MRAQISPHPHQHLLLSIILIMAFLVYVKVWFAFLWGLCMLGIFSCANWSFVSFLWRNPVLDIFLSLYWICYNTASFYVLFFFWPRGMWDLTSLIRDRTHTPRLVQFSHSVMSDSLQHAKLACPSPTPGAYSNSCPLSQGYHPTISPSVVSFSSHLQSLPASGSFPMSQFFTWDGQSITVSASASVLPMNIQG